MQTDGHLTVGGSSERPCGGLGSSGAGPSVLSDARVKDLLEQGSGGSGVLPFFLTFVNNGAGLWRRPSLDQRKEASDSQP